jgi:hypothetical protein
MRCEEDTIYLFRDGEDTITKSSTIVNYLETKYPSELVECDQDQSVLHLTQGFFPAFATFMMGVR